MKYRVYVENKDTRFINGLDKVDPEFEKRGLLVMRRLKLEMYVDILKVLAHHGSLKLTHIMRARFSVSLSQFFFLYSSSHLEVS